MATKAKIVSQLELPLLAPACDRFQQCASPKSLEVISISIHERNLSAWSRLLFLPQDLGNNHPVVSASRPDTPPHLRNHFLPSKKCIFNVHLVTLQKPSLSLSHTAIQQHSPLLSVPAAQVRYMKHHSPNPPRGCDRYVPIIFTPSGQ
jgi:hypothetical protein